MNNVITTKCGEIINLRMVINDKSDTHGHTLIIRHINNQQSKIDQLKEDLKIANHKLNKKEIEMNLYKVTFVTGSKPSSIRVKAKNENLAWGYAKQYGLPSKVEAVCSRLWHLIWPALFGIGLYGAQML